jgi:hypothetical protein
MLMVHLKPMTEEVFRTWRDSSIKSFAQEKIAVGTWNSEEALFKANEAFAELLPNDLHTEHHYQESGSKAPYLRTALVLDVLFQNFDRCATD